MRLHIQATSGHRRSMDLSIDPLFFQVNPDVSDVVGRAKIQKRNNTLIVRTISLDESSANITVNKYDIDHGDEEMGVVTGFVGGRTLKVMKKAADGNAKYVITEPHFHDIYKKALSNFVYM